MSVKDGGMRIEFADQDPRIRRMYLEALERNGIQRQVEDFSPRLR